MMSGRKVLLINWNRPTTRTKLSRRSVACVTRLLLPTLQEKEWHQMSGAKVILRSLGALDAVFEQSRGGGDCIT